jgi:hypothetical protein
MKLKLEQLESRLQALIEVRLVSALPGYRVEDVVIHKIADAMKSNLVEREGDRKTAPNVYTLICHPDSMSKWQEPRLLEALIHSLKIVGEEAGLQFATPPTISIMQDPGHGQDFINVVASHQVEPVADTQGMTPSEGLESSVPNDTVPEQAFLIVDGVKVFPLKQSVINIGRRMDNQLVIDDPRVSRNHAQLRAIKGRFIVFDLNSTGGTFVNGQRSNQSVLYPGDVISLAGVPLVFGQDNPPPRPDLADTSPLDAASMNQHPAPERPTATLERKTGKFPEKDDGEE